ILEFNIQKDHIHIVMWIPPKYSISAVMGFLKGKLSLRLFQRYEQLGKKVLGGDTYGPEDTV
ncbi:MAG: transposase, partial [Syntrophaceae bacterium]|nr:transposase [Syntrophaceae bacterium]